MLDIAQEDTCIPIELSTLNKDLGEITLRFLRKRLYGIDILFYHIAHLDITITRFWTGRLDCHRQETVVSCNKRQALQYILAESLFIEDGLIGRSIDDARIRVQHGDAMVSPSHTWSRIAMNRLSHNAVGRYLWQLLFHQIYIFLVGIDINMVGRYYLCHAIECLLQLGTSDSKEVNELFWMTAPTAWPKSSTFSTCENHTIIIIIIKCHIIVHFL